MRLGRQRMWVSGLALGLMAAGAPTVAHGSGQATQASAAAGQQTVPNAPTPQTLPQLNTITPVGPNAPLGTGPASSASTDNTDNDGVAPGATLPSTVPATASAQDQDQGPPPVAHASQLTVSVNLVQVPFTVKDSKNHLVPGLTYRDVRIYENGLRQHMSLFSSSPVALSVALVIDQSVTFDTMRKINDSLSALQGAFATYDEVAVFTYGNGVTEQTDFTAAQSARLGVILERSKGQGTDPMMGLTGPLAHGAVINNAPIDGVPTTGQVQGSLQINPPREIHTLLDAVFAAAKQTTQAGKDRRRIVYVISDGKEYGSQITEKDLIKYLQTNKVEVYATLVGDSAVPGLGFLDRIHLPLTMRDDVLPRITAATGGQTDPEFRPRGIQSSFAKITEEVRNQYTIGFYTHISPFNEHFRSIDVRVMRPGLTVIAEPGYYPSASDSRPATSNSPVAPPARSTTPAMPPATQ